MFNFGFDSRNLEIRVYITLNVFNSIWGFLISELLNVLKGWVVFLMQFAIDPYKFCESTRPVEE